MVNKIIISFEDEDDLIIEYNPEGFVSWNNVYNKKIKGILIGSLGLGTYELQNASPSS